MMEQPIRVAHIVTASTGIGGMETHLLTLVRHLDRQEFSPVVILPETARHLGLDERLREMAVPVTFQAMVRNKWDVATLWSQTTLLRRYAPHIVHVHLPSAYDNLYPFVAARLAACPVVISTEHSASGRGLFRRLRVRLFKQAMVALQDSVITVCDYVRDQLCQHAGVPARKVVTIYNGVELPPDDGALATCRRTVRLELGLDTQTPVAGMVARIDPWHKRFDDFVRTAGHIVQDVPAAHFVIVGDGDRRYRGALEQLAQHLGLADRIHFLGYRHDASSVIAALDTLVLASDHEGFPLVTLEAMARGTPVVATALGGVREQILDGETGYLVPPRDTAALAAAIMNIWRNPQRSREVATRARHAVEKRFTAPVMAGQTQALYRRLLSGKQPLSQRAPSLPGVP